jgi:dynein regulatory complex subunit 2
MAKKKDKKAKTEFGMYKDEETRRKAMDEIKRIQTEKRITEDSNSKLNSVKIQNRWRELMKIGF